MNTPADTTPAKPSWIDRHQATVTLFGTVVGALSILILGYGAGYVRKYLEGDASPASVTNLTSYDKTVDAHGYPQSMNFEVKEDAIIRIRQKVDADDWRCGGDKVSLLGEGRKGADFLAPGARFCEIIAGVGAGEVANIIFSPVGPDMEWEADNTGVLYLGANDEGEEYGNNEGIIRLEIFVTEK